MISCNALAGISTPQALKIEGYIKKKKVIVLIDSGSTHNFIHDKLAKDLNCFVYPAPEFQVMIAYGGTINCSGKCNKINLTMGEYVMNSPMIAIPMGGADVVLGIQWLQSLGTMAFNFQELFMKFSLEGKEIELRGITGKPDKVISSNSMTKLLKKGHQGIIAQLCSLDAQTSKPSIPQDLQRIIDKHSKVFEDITKYAHFCALSHSFKASTVATAFMETVQKLHGIPKIIVSDRDPIFTGHFWTELFSCLGTQLAHSSSYHPQSDGQTEIVNKCLEGYLRCFVSDKQTQWFKWLPLAEWWYNTSFHTATKMTPFMALYGYHPPSITSSLKEKSKVQAVEDHIENQQQILQILKDNLTMVQNRMKQQADQHRSERSFEVGDWVFLRIQPYKQMSLKQAKKDNKLTPKYYGPYKVLQKIGTMAYKLELPASS
jgi:DNA-binding ferritin-like protein